MAGPTSSVLLRSIPNRAIIDLIYEVIDRFATSREGDDFMISSSLVSSEEESLRAFGLELNLIHSDYYDFTKEQLESIAEKTSFYPQFDVGMYAMSNRMVDHLILGFLTLKIAETLNGMIDFGGELQEEKIKHLNGKIYAIDYETDTGKFARFHIADLDFMRNWIKDEHFYMIK